MVNPWMKTVTLATANTAYNLYTLMAAVDSTAPDHCKQLTLQVDPAYAGTYVYVGNSDVSASIWGRKIVATQFPEQGPMMLNGISLKYIYLFPDHNSAVIGVTAIVE